MNTASKLSLAVVALLAIGTTTVQAQQATIQATAQVQTALTVSFASNLAFGNVFPGQGNQTVAAGAANAGSFALTGEPGATVQLTFTLPTVLTGPGADMAIGTWTGLYNNASTAAGGSALTVSAAPVNVVLDGTTGANWAFVGATLTVPAVQTAGSYAADIVLDAVYTGN